MEGSKDRLSQLKNNFIIKSNISEEILFVTSHLLDNLEKWEELKNHSLQEIKNHYFSIIEPKYLEIYKKLCSWNIFKEK